MGLHYGNFYDLVTVNGELAISNRPGIYLLQIRVTLNRQYANNDYYKGT